MRKSIQNSSRPWTSPTVRNPTYPMVVNGAAIKEMPWPEDEELLQPKISSDPKGSPDEELWHADPNCQHDIRSAPGGGVKCSKCPGWFCY
jgi:hypothetical protein